MNGPGLVGKGSGDKWLQKKRRVEWKANNLAQLALALCCIQL